MSRAFDRGGVQEQEKMQLLIDWRLASCKYENDQAFRAFTESYKIDDMRNIVPTGSRGLDAYNWLSVLDNRNDFLRDEDYEAKLKEMERMHHVSRFFKNSQIKVDLHALKRQSQLANPQAPITFDIPETQPGQRNDEDAVYFKSNEVPAYLKLLNSQKKEAPISASYMFITKPPKFH